MQPLFKSFLVRYFCLMMLLFAPYMAFASSGSEYITKYLQFWLKEHQVESVIDDNHVLSIPNISLSFSGEILDIDQKSDDLFLVHTQFRVHLPDGRTIVENVVGTGRSANDAFLESLQNLSMTTFYPVYAQYIDSQDEHVNVREVNFLNGKRKLVFADWMLRGSQLEQGDLDVLLEDFFGIFQTKELNQNVHWGKLNALYMDGEIKRVEFELDNDPREDMSKEIFQIKWPTSSSNFYIAKLFFIIDGQEK